MALSGSSRITRNGGHMENDLESAVKFVKDVIKDFEGFVADAMYEGHHKNFDDHNDFLQACFELFLESKEE